MSNFTIFCECKDFGVSCFLFLAAIIGAKKVKFLICALMFSNYLAEIEYLKIT